MLLKSVLKRRLIVLAQVGCFFTLALIVITFVYKPVVAQNSNSIFSRSYYDQDRAFSIGIPKYWVTNENAFLNMNYKDINGAVVHFLYMYPESDNGSRITRYVYIQYTGITDWFSLPSVLGTMLSHNDMINNYIDQKSKNTIHFSVITTELKRVNGNDVYQIESEGMYREKTLYRDIERFIFVGDRVYYLDGSYISSQPQYKDVVLSAMDSFTVLNSK